MTSISEFARTRPDHPAAIVYETGASISFAELENASRNVANELVRRGLQYGDRVAILMENSLEYFIAMWAVRRAGMYIVPVNWHLRQNEIRHILENSQSRGLIASESLRHLAEDACPESAGPHVRMVSGESIAGWLAFDEIVARPRGGPVRAERDGAPMYYTGGTTGAPKGILRPLSGEAFGAASLVEQVFTPTYGLGAETRYLSPAPMYHAAPIGWTMMVQRVGGCVILLQSFDAERALAAIDEYRVTHAQFVPTHFVRMLKLSDEVRSAYTLRSLEYVIHAAAPCPETVKAKMLDWVGPKVFEYYGGSERCGFTAIGPEEAMSHPGSVGRSLHGGMHILDPESGRELPHGEAGLVYFDRAEHFEYYGQPGQSAKCFNDAGWGTMGDVGYLDKEGYLFLVDRLSNMIISGGVNIYPQEIEDSLIEHPDVLDVAVLGIPDDEYGQRVHAVIVPSASAASDPELVSRLDQHCRSRIAGYKRPKTYEFVSELPRLPSGKLQKRILYERRAPQS
ncbi:MAG: AMP-binding protein [Henriciella sp.]|uniref:AMP-binding protein n=1 Tax=Henriciella sp. TaxID=1968823 RepID=UPI0032EE48DD